MSKKYYLTDHLFPRTGYLIGAGSIFNIAGNYFEFNSSLSEDEADCIAIESDWGTVANDLKKIIEATPVKSLKSSNQ